MHQVPSLVLPTNQLLSCTQRTKEEEWDQLTPMKPHMRLHPVTLCRILMRRLQRHWRVAQAQPKALCNPRHSILIRLFHPFHRRSFLLNRLHQQLSWPHNMLNYSKPTSGYAVIARLWLSIHRRIQTIDPYPHGLSQRKLLSTATLALSNFRRHIQISHLWRQSRRVMTTKTHNISLPPRSICIDFGTFTQMLRRFGLSIAIYIISP